MKYVLFLFAVMFGALCYFGPAEDNSEYNAAVFFTGPVIAGLISAAAGAGTAAKTSHDAKSAARRAQENRLMQFAERKKERESDLEAQKRQRDQDKEADLAKSRQPLIQEFQQGEQKLQSLGIEDTGRGNLANRILGGGARRV